MNTAIDAEEYDDNQHTNAEIVELLEKRRTEFLINFMKKYKEKEIKPYYKSAKTKDIQMQRSKVFYNVVGDSYEEIVEQSNESFLLLVCIQLFDYCIELKKSIREIGMHLMAYGNRSVFSNFRHC